MKNLSILRKWSHLQICKWFLLNIVTDEDVQTWTKNQIRNAICSLANDISILNNTEGEREKQFYEKNLKNSKKAELIQYLDSIKDLKETLNVNHIDIEFSQE